MTDARPVGVVVDTMVISWLSTGVLIQWLTATER